MSTDASTSNNSIGMHRRVFDDIPSRQTTEAGPKPGLRLRILADQMTIDYRVLERRIDIPSEVWRPSVGFNPSPSAATLLPTLITLKINDERDVNR